MSEKTNEITSFVMYKEWGQHFEVLENEELGQLLRAVYDFQCWGELTEFEDRTLRIIFNMMRECFIRDSARWAEVKRQRSLAGAKGARAKHDKAEQS